MPAKNYGYRDGYRGSVDAQVVGEELERLRKKEGSLTAEGTVKEAEKRTSPLHNLFEWSDEDAGHLYRLVQARTLLRSVTVIVQDRPPVNQYVSVRTEEKGVGRKYEPMEVVARSVDYFQSALELLEEKLAGAVRAVQDLRDAAGLSKHKGKMAIIATVVKALEVAAAAVKKIAA